MRSLFAVTLLGLFAAACGSKVGDKYPTIDTFCEAKAQEECQVAPRCAVTVEACIQDRASGCVTASLTTIQTTGRTYVPANAQACLDVVNRIYASGLVPPTETDVTRSGSMAEVCAQVFLGSADKNQGCSVDADCMFGRMCAAAIVGTTTRVCADPVPKLEGEFCADPGSVCTSGTFCSTIQGAPICQKKAALGESCSLTFPCTEALRCDGLGRCSERMPAGASCASNDDCAAEAPMCDPAAGFVCDIGLSFAPPPSTACSGYGR
jgi:hypothetical protein